MTLAAEARLTQDLIRIASLPGQEAAVMARFAEALTELGYDEVCQDAAGNVIGLLSRGEGPRVMLNGHLDIVPTGDEALWPHPPFAAEVESGMIWGRGAVDMKGALACMAHAAKDALEAGFAGTLMVTAVVQEEVGGLGARHLAEHLAADVVVLGEPSELELKLGHRGRVEVEVALPGRIAHAAKNELGDNALYRAADLLAKLRALELPRGGPLGGSSLTPTCLQSFPEEGRNVVPGRAELIIDYRTIPGDTPEALLARLRALEPEARFEIPLHHATSENGKVSFHTPQQVGPYLAPQDGPWTRAARAGLKRSLARRQLPYREGVWWFSTDAPHLAKMGAVVLGFGPGDPELAHTSQERVPLRHLEVARAAYCDLALAFQDAHREAHEG